MGCSHQVIRDVHTLGKDGSLLEPKKSRSLVARAIAAHGGSHSWHRVKSFAYEGHELKNSLFTSLFINGDFSERIAKKIFLGISRDNFKYQGNLGLKAQMIPLFEMPFVLKEALSLSYVGESFINGDRYHLVTADFRQDRFVVWVHHLTNLVGSVEYVFNVNTANEIRGQVIYQDLRVVSGVVVPFSIRFVGSPFSIYTNGYHWDRVKANITVTRAHSWYTGEHSL